MSTLIGTLSAISPQLHGILLQFLYLVLILAVIGGLIWCIETWFHPIPPPIKLVIAIILVILVIIWAINALGG